MVSGATASTTAATEPSPPPIASTSTTPTIAATPLEAVPMLGPFKTLAEVCKALASGKTVKAFDCLPGPTIAPPPKDAPIDRATLLVLSAKGNADTAVTHLALHVAKGWFVHPDGPEASSDAAMGKHYHTDVIPDSSPEFFPAGIIPGTTYALRYDFAEITNVVATDPTTGKKSGAKLHGVRGTTIVCAIGASGSPSCLDPIRTDLQLGKAGMPPPELAKVAFAIDSGVWNVDPAKHVSQLRSAGHPEARKEVPLAGAYALHFP
jgi:hypothetical protein